MRAETAGAPKEVIAQVSRGDIRDGRPHRAGQCPVALALNRQHGALGRWQVSGRVAFLFLPESDGGWIARYSLLEEGEEFAHRFDQGQPVRPLRLVLPYLGTFRLPPLMMGTTRAGGARG